MAQEAQADVPTHPVGLYVSPEAGIFIGSIFVPPDDAGNQQPPADAGDADAPPIIILGVVGEPADAGDAHTFPGVIIRPEDGSANG